MEQYKNFSYQTLTQIIFHPHFRISVLTKFCIVLHGTYFKVKWYMSK